MASSKTSAAGGASLPATTLTELVPSHWAIQCLCLTILPTSRIACNVPADRTVLPTTIPDYVTIDRTAARLARERWGNRGRGVKDAIITGTPGMSSLYRVLRCFTTLNSNGPVAPSYRHRPSPGP